MNIDQDRVKADDDDTSNTSEDDSSDISQHSSIYATLCASGQPARSELPSA